LNYPILARQQVTVTMTVTECVVTAINAVTTLDGLSKSYTILDPQIQIPFAYVQVPACGYTLGVTTSTDQPTSALSVDMVNN